MYSDADLDAAVGAGVLSADAVTKFRAFVSGQRASPGVDEEHFRLLTGFNDIFVSIAILLLLIAVGWLAHSVTSAFGGVAVAAVSWGLAEYFTRRRRMALPSILLLMGFANAVFYTGFVLLGGFTVTVDHPSPVPTIGVPAAIAVVAVYGHWRRFMVPITPAAGCIGLVAALVATFLSLVPAAKPFLSLFILLGGLGVFSWAMAWDMSDPTRITRRSDVAFWLHLTAAPMMVHPAFAMLGLAGLGSYFTVAGASQTADLGAAFVAVAIYLCLAVVALIIDRRALLVSALFYVLYAISTLFRAAGSLTLSLALTALVIGSGLLLLSAFWHSARAVVVKGVPTGIRARLPAI